MADYSLYKSVPWIVNLFLLWKPLYKKTSNNEKLLDYIETLVFIHSVYDSKGKEVSANDIDYLEVVTQDSIGQEFGEHHIEIKRTALDNYKETSESDDTLKKTLKVNCYGVGDSGDTSINNLNVRLSDSSVSTKNTGYNNFYSCGNIADKILGSLYINESIYHSNDKSAYQNGILFKIHMKGGKRYANYTYNSTKRKYEESSSKYKNSAVIYGVASNPFYFPKYIFDTSLPPTDDEALSFGSNLASNNITQCFVCGGKMGLDQNDSPSNHISDEISDFKVCYYNKDYLIDERPDLINVAKNNANISNYNYTLSVKELINGNYTLSLASPFPLQRVNSSAYTFNLYQRYDDNDYNILDSNYSSYEDINTISMFKIKNYNNNINLLKFSVMNDKTKKELKADFDLPYNIAKVSATNSKFCWWDESESSEYENYEGNCYIVSNTNKEINFETVEGINSQKNILCKLTPIAGGLDYIASPYDIYTNNKWFFGSYSLKDKPSLLFYGMYKVTGSTTGE